MENSSGFHSEEELKKKAEETISRMDRIRREYEGILEHTLTFDDKLPWEQMMCREAYGEFRYDRQKPIPPEFGKKKLLPIFDKTAERKREYINALGSYQRDKNSALIEYLDKSEKFTNEMITCNTKLEYLKYYFEKSEKSAVEEYAYKVLERSEYPESLKRNFHVEYHKDLKTIEVSYLFQSLNDFPNIEGYEYLPKVRKIRWKAMPYERALEFYDRTVLTVCLRTLHELFEGIYTDAVDTVLFNGYVRSGNCNIPDGRVTQTFEKAFIHNVRCVFGVKTDRKRFGELPLDGRKAEKILELMTFKRTRNFHDAVQLMAPLTAED